MPILNIKICTSPSPETSARVAAILTDLTIEVLKKKRELTVIVLEHIPASQWFIAGSALASQSLASFCLEIKVTEGTNTKDEKAQYISRVFAAMEEIIGPLAPANYIVVHDVRGDSWGYQGETQEYRYIFSKSL